MHDQIVSETMKVNISEAESSGLHVEQKASDYVRKNTNVKGQPNLTAGLFCQWVNENLLPYSNVQPGFLRKVSIKTCHQWLHKMGFEQLSPNKGMYFNGHERERMSFSTAKNF